MHGIEAKQSRPCPDGLICGRLRHSTGSMEKNNVFPPKPPVKIFNIFSVFLYYTVLLVFAVFSKDDFQYTAGKIATFKRRDLVTPVVRHFCSNCGTAIGNKSPTNPNLMIVKIGTFDDQSFFTPMLAIFTCDKQSYHYIPEGIPTFEKRIEKS